MPYAWLADAVLAFHLLYVLCVVLPVPLMILGRRRWGWVRSRALRIIHLAMIAYVAVQSLLGAWCPLTLLENYLRRQAGETSYHTGFIADWASRTLYWHLPPWAFGAIYVGFALLVIVLWFAVPPRPRAQAVS